MKDPYAFDRQLGDMVWVVVTALKSGYSMHQILEQLAAEAPTPAKEYCSQLLQNIENGQPLDQAITHLHSYFPSKHLPQVVAVVLAQQKHGGNLAFMLEPIGKEILDACGSDGKFTEMMRTLAAEVNAPLPEHIDSK